MEIEIIDFNFNVIEKVQLAKKGAFEMFEDIKYKDLPLFPEDTLTTLKEKVYLKTGYFPFRLCVISENEILDHEVYIDEQKYNPLDNKEEEFIDGVRLNKYVFNNRDNLEIINTEYRNVRELGKIKILLLPEIKNVSEILYFSVVCLFPYLNYEAFVNFAKEAYDIYPNIFVEKSNIYRKLLKESELYIKIYDNLQKDLSEYNIGLLEDKNDKTSNLSFSINEVLIIEEIRSMVDLENLFIVFETTPEIPIIEFTNGSVILTKIHSNTNYDMYEKFLQKEKSRLIFLHKGNEIYFNVQANGNIFICSNFHKGYDFSDMEKKIKEAKKDFFNQLNAVKISLYGSNKIYIGEILKISATMNYVGDFGGFEEFSDEIRKYCKGENKLNWEKGCVLNTEPYNWNSFAPYYDNNYIFKSDCKFDLINRGNELRIMISDMRHIDFKNFFKFLVYFLTLKPKIESSVSLGNLKLLKLNDPANYNAGKYKGDVVYPRFCQKKKQPLILNAEEAKKYKSDKLMEFWNYTKEEPAFFYCENGYPGFITGYHPNGYCQVCCRKKKELLGKYAEIHESCLKNKIFDEIKEDKNSKYVINYGKILEPGRVGNLPNIINKFLVYNLEEINIISDSVSLQVFKFNGKVYDVNKLLKITAKTKIEYVDFEFLEPFLYKPVWKRKRKEQELIIPMEVIKNPEENKKYKKHYKKIIKSNLEEPILVYKFNNQMIIIDGLHRLAKYYLEKKNEVIVKFVTLKQLERSFIGKYDLTDVSFINDLKPVEIRGGSDKEPFYYMYGVQQKYKDKNVSYANSIANIFDMKFEDLLTLDYDSGFYTKEKINEVLGNLTGTEIELNEFFNNILTQKFNYIPLILEDKGEIILNIYGNIDFRENNEYVILMKNENNYNPVYVIIPYAYYRNKIIEKKTYTIDDQIIKIIRDIYEKKKKINSLTLKNITKIAKQEKLFYSANLFYGGEFSIGNKIFYLGFEPVKGEGSDEVFKFKKYDSVIKVLNQMEFIQVDKVYIKNKKVVAAIVNNYVCFCWFDESELEKEVIFKGVKKEVLKYDIESLMNINSTHEDPILADYYKYDSERNDYLIYKSNPKIFNSSKEKSKKFQKALELEKQDPIKKKLFELGIFNFSRIFWHKSLNEEIYIKKIL